MSRHEGEVLQRLTLSQAICDLEQASGSSAKLNRILEILDIVSVSVAKAVCSPTHYSYFMCLQSFSADTASRESC